MLLPKENAFHICFYFLVCDVTDWERGKIMVVFLRNTTWLREGARWYVFLDDDNEIL